VRLLLENQLADGELPIKSTRGIVASRAGRNGYPDEHAVGVAELVLEMVDRLQLQGRIRSAAIQGALLHDVGKLAIEESILAKPGPLDSEERRRLARHPVEGERLVRGAVSDDVCDVVRAHHERWDGTGYPYGLLGDEIPLAARLVAVADAFQAMLEDRPYRSALTTSEALDELSACAGSQFDPACVAALVAVVRAALA
jgi:HD-GYP domain-containing protein (c-di-GMP phosphodiesterase class II)